jgi:hypothetical protein
LHVDAARGRRLFLAALGLAARAYPRRPDESLRCAAGFADATSAPSGARAALAHRRGQTLVNRPLQQRAPFGFPPLLVERLREQLTTEALVERIARRAAELQWCARTGEAMA